MKLPYDEGTWCAVPLRKGGFAAGLVARATKKGKVLLCYFFGPYQTVPALNDLSGLEAREAVLAIRVGDLALIEGAWPIVGSMPSWRREQWPMPLFVRQEPFSKRVWLVHRSDEDPNVVAREELLSQSPPDHLRTDSLSGSGAAEIILTKLLNRTVLRSAK